MSGIDETTAIVEMRFGSHLYGTATPASDTDLKRVHLPSAEAILLQRVRPVISTQTKVDARSKNRAEDIDQESFVLHKFLALVADGQTVAMDMLFAPASMVLGAPSPIWTELQENADRLVSRQCKSFIGYCRQQANKYGVRGSRVAAARYTVEILDAYIARGGERSKLGDHADDVAAAIHGREFMAVVMIPQVSGVDAPHLEVCDRKAPYTVTCKEARAIFQRVVDQYGQRALQAERNEGVDWKALSHAVRVGRQAIELLATGRITFPRPEAQRLIAIKLGEVPYRAVAEEIEHLFEDVERGAAVSPLPERPDFDWIDGFVCAAYADVVRTAT